MKEESMRWACLALFAALAAASEPGVAEIGMAGLRKDSPLADVLFESVAG